MALGIGVLGGALGTVMMLPVVTKSTIAPTPQPTTHAQHPLTVLAAMGPEIEMSDDLMECRKQMGSCYAQLEACASTSRPVTTSLAAMPSDQLATPQQELVTDTANHLECGGEGGCQGNAAELAHEYT